MLLMIGHLSGVTIHLSGVNIHLSGVTICLSGVTIHLSGVNIHLSGVIICLSGVIMVLAASYEFDKRLNSEIVERPSDNEEIPEVITKSYFCYSI